MKALSFFPLFLLFSLPALADFNGKWEGIGEATNPNGFSTPCHVELDIRQTSTRLEIRNRKVECAFFESQWQKIPLEIRGNDLWMNGGSFGTIEGNHIQAHNWPGLVLKNGKVLRTHTTREDFTMDVSDQGLRYQERWVDEGDTVTHMKIEVLLKK